MATPIPTQGTKFEIMDNATTPALQVIGGIQNISGFESGQANTIDTTTLASTAKEKILGLVDNGSFTIDGVWDTTDVGQTELEEMRIAGDTRQMKITLSNAVTKTFNCLVSSGDKSGGVDDVMKVTFNIEINGAVTTA